MTTTSEPEAAPTDIVEPAFGRFRDDVVLMFVSQGLTLFLTIASSALVARALGPGGRGIYAAAFAFAAILVQFGSFGVATANAHFVASHQARTRDLISNSVLIAVSFGAALVLIGATIKFVFPSAVQGVSWTELLVALAAVPFALLQMFLQGVLLGEGRMLPYNLVAIATGLASFAVLLVGIAALDWGVAELLAIITGNYALAATLYLYFLRSHGPPLAGFRRSLAESMLSYGFRIHLAAFMSFLVINIDLLMVNGFLGSDQSGYYSLVAALVSGLTMLPVVVGVSLFPRISGGSEDSTTASVFRNLSLIYGALCLSAILFVPLAVRLLYGPQFENEVPYLFNWIVPGAFALGMLSVLSHHFAGRGFPWEAVHAWVPGVVFNIVANAILLPIYGTVVAPITSTITYSIVLGLYMRMFARETGGYGSMMPRPREFVSFVRATVSRSTI